MMFVAGFITALVIAAIAFLIFLSHAFKPWG